MVQMHENIVGLDAAILMHPTTWKASGHVDAFNDPLIDNKDSKKRYRADVLIEDYAEKLNQKAQKEIDKARERFGASFDEEQYKTTNPRVMEYLSKKKEILERMARSLETENLADVKALIEELEIACPDSGSKKLDRCEAIQLNVRNKIRSFCRKRNGFIPASRNSSRNFRKLLKCSKNRSYEDSFRNCSNG